MSIQISIRMDLKEFLLDVDFSSDADRIGILGASGSGKSLTLKSIAGVMRPGSGRIVLNGRTLFDTTGRKKIDLPPQKRRTGYLFQNYALFPSMTVRENIACGLANRGDCQKKTGADRKAMQAELVDGMIRRFRLGGLEKRYPSELSGGQQQRTALARILIGEPDAILLDEPFSALDQFLRERLQEELMEMLADYEGVLILVSHSRDEIYRFSKEILVLDGGRCVNAGPTRQVFADPGNEATARLTGCRNFSRAVRLDEHTVRALDWGAALHLQRAIPEDVRSIGFRDTDFVPVYGERRDNCIRFAVRRSVEMPGEKQYYLQPAECRADEGEGSALIWRVLSDGQTQNAGKMPDYLQLPEDKILLLT